jgi:hypothetical protein
VGDEAARVLDQEIQYGECLGRQIDLFAVAPQAAVGRVEPESVKLLHHIPVCGKDTALFSFIR